MAAPFKSAANDDPAVFHTEGGLCCDTVTHQQGCQWCSHTYRQQALKQQLGIKIDTVWGKSP